MRGFFMNEVFIDFETRSTVDLKKVGLDNYAKHPTTDVLGMCWVDSGGDGVVWRDNLELPRWFSKGVLTGDLINVAHNAQFELAIWNHLCVPRYGWPELKVSQVRCTAAMAHAAALPGSLDGCSKALGLPVTKDLVGHRLMMRMCKPKKIHDDGRIEWIEDDASLERLMQYCMTDVLVEQMIYNAIPKLSDSEQHIWELDQKINNRGVYVDLHSIDSAIQIVEQEQKRLGAKMRRITNGKVKTCSQAKALTEWLRDSGLDIEGVAKSDLNSALAGDLQAHVREALEIRQEAAKSSTAKLVAMRLNASEDSRVRGVLQYHGAATGRWAGRKIQTQNFPRGNLKPKAVEMAIRLMNEGNAQMLDLLFGSPLTTISSCLRGMLMAPPGKELISCDFSAIEARVLAWLAGQEDVLDIFRGHGKIYEHAAAGIYNKPMAEVTGDERQIGKVAVLALGYQGGKGAFQQMAKAYGMKVSDARADEIKVAWRNANPATVKYWWALEKAAVNAVLNPTETYSAGAKGREVRFRRKGKFLYCRLPSGRLLSYANPSIVINKFDRESLQYWGVDSLTKKWTIIGTYGGKLAENVTQAVARDLLAEALVRLESHGFEVINHIHDEIVVEIEDNAPEDTLYKVEQLMAVNPPWADGLPLAAEGWRGKRYRK